MNILQKYFVPGLLVFGTLFLAFWMVMAKVNRREGVSFDLTPEAFVNFHPAIEGWITDTMPVTRDSYIDANIAAYSLVRDYSSSVTDNRQPITNNHYLIRLVHGYNMPMCMKLKYYTVEKIQDYKVRSVSDPKLQSAYRSLPSTTQQLSNLTTILPTELPYQLWRLTSSVGTVSIWVTTMIRSDDFSATSEDICSMAFPRVDVPDDPGWVPRGFGLEELKHPVATFRRWYLHRWNGARWDVLTFLGLRRSVGASNELLSYITKIEDLPSGGPRDADIQDLLEIHATMLKDLQAWRLAERRNALY